MSVLQEKVDNLYGKVFSEVNKKSFEIATLWLSIIGFFIHLFLIYAKKFSLLNLPIESGLLDNPISAIYTPFTIILIYEIYLLVLNLPRSFTTSVSKQFEIISLILIRRIFADIPKIDLEADWLTTAANVQLIYDVLGVLIMYYLIYLFNKSRLKLDKKPMTPSISRFVSSKKAVSIILLVILIIISLEIIRELPITLILRPFNFETFATTAYIYASEDLLEAVAAPSLFLILIASFFILLSSKYILRDNDE